jgi:hypothetical protein
MKTKRRTVNQMLSIFVLGALIISASSRLRADTGDCGGRVTAIPFTDVSGNLFFCQIAEAYFAGLTYGTDATHYSPSEPVPREQMAAFITRTQDSILKRGSLRAALNLWSQGAIASSGMTTVVGRPISVSSDGADLWVASEENHTVSRVRASDGKLLGTWVGAVFPSDLVIARGSIYISGDLKLYRIDPRQPAGPVETVTSDLRRFPQGITTDGFYIWIAFAQAIQRVNPATGDVTTFVTPNFGYGNLIYARNHIWLTDQASDKLFELNLDGTTEQTITVGHGPIDLVFDGTNIWVSNPPDNPVSVVRASTGTVLATLTGNGLNVPGGAAFDGQRILITNFLGDSVSLWKATDLTALGYFSAPSGSGPVGACSDGINFWIALADANKLARF